MNNNSLNPTAAAGWFWKNIFVLKIEIIFIFYIMTMIRWIVDFNENSQIKYLRLVMLVNEEYKIGCL